MKSKEEIHKIYSDRIAFYISCSEQRSNTKIEEEYSYLYEKAMDYLKEIRLLELILEIKPEKSFNPQILLNENFMNEEESPRIFFLLQSSASAITARAKSDPVYECAICKWRGTEDNMLKLKIEHAGEFYAGVNLACPICSNQQFYNTAESKK